MWRDMWVEYFLIGLLAVLVALAILLVVKTAERQAENRAACLASGRAWVVDHFETTHIWHKIGDTMIDTPVQSPVYACVEQ